MRIHAAFHTLIVFTTVLIFSAPFVTPAQQNPTQTAVTKDANALRLEVKAAAEQDASDDLNKPLWFISGTTAVGCALIGGFIGCLVGESTAPSGGGLGFAPLIDFSDSAVTVGLIGCAAGALVPFIGIYNYQGNPPSERLLGKSPEYVESYTNAYKVKARLLRTSMAVAGAATAGGGLGLCLIGLIQN